MKFKEKPFIKIDMCKYYIVTYMSLTRLVTMEQTEECLFCVAHIFVSGFGCDTQKFNIFLLNAFSYSYKLVESIYDYRINVVCAFFCVSLFSNFNRKFVYSH